MREIKSKHKPNPNENICWGLRASLAWKDYIQSDAEDGCQQWEGVHVERVISASSVGLLFAGEAWAEFLKKLSEIPNTLPPTG